MGLKQRIPMKFHSEKRSKRRQAIRLLIASLPGITRAGSMGMISARKTIDDFCMAKKIVPRRWGTPNEMMQR
jgi:hypothetical protein